MRFETFHLIYLAAFVYIFVAPIFCTAWICYRLARVEASLAAYNLWRAYGADLRPDTIDDAADAFADHQSIMAHGVGCPHREEMA